MAAEEEAVRPWQELTREILVDVFCRLGFEERYLTLGFVCKAWARAARDASCWAVADMEECFHNKAQHQPELMARWWNPEFERRVDVMVKNVVEWSCGKLSELHLRHCSDSAIEYATARCPGLHSLTVKESPGFTDTGGAAVARACPNVQHLDFTDCQRLSVDSLKEIGTSCKSLLTLKRNMLTLENNWHKRQFIPSDYLQAQPSSSADEEASIISTTMPQLRNLEYRHSDMSDRGLVALAAGCLKLEYLDVSGCKRLSLAALNLASQMLPNLKSFQKPTPIDSNYMDSLRYGHWQLYSKRLQSSFQF